MSNSTETKIMGIELSSVLESLVNKVKTSLSDSKSVAVSQAWAILQIAIAQTIQAIEDANPLLKGATKKEIALNMISMFYDKVFLIVTIPYVPSFLQPIISKYTKKLLMLLVGAAIDSMVEIFRNNGIFNKKEDIK